MSTQEQGVPMVATDEAIIAAIEGSRTALVDAAEIVKRSALTEAHETIDGMVRAHERLCALATTLVRA